MIILRSALFFAVFVLGIVGYGTIISLTGRLLPAAINHALVSSWGRFNRRALALICNLRVEISGLERLPPPPYVILSKHQSAWETVTMQGIFPPLVLLLKQSLMYIPIFGWALWASRQIPIDRSQGVDALRLLHEVGKQRLDEGLAVLIFPEGTRVKAGEVGKYNAGGVSLALQNGVPIIPVAHNAGYYWPRNGFLKKPGIIRMQIGEPIPTAGLERTARRALQQQVQERIETMMGELGP